MMQRPRVVAFLGRAGAGKTTAANYLVKRYGAQLTGFAWPLKKLAQLLWEFSDEQVYGTQEAKETLDERCGISPRVAMQRLGDGVRETIYKTVWVDACIDTIVRSFRKDPTKDLWVIDDARYCNEAAGIASHPSIYGHVVKLECPDAESTADPDHPSEAEVDKVSPLHLSHTIVSRRSPEAKDLLGKVEAVFATLFVPQASRDALFTTHGIDSPE